MEDLGSATMKLHSLPKALRGRGNLSAQKPHDYEKSIEKLAFSFPTEAINLLKITYIDIKYQGFSCLSEPGAGGP